MLFTIMDLFVENSSSYSYTSVYQTAMEIRSCNILQVFFFAVAGVLGIFSVTFLKNIIYFLPHVSNS